MTTRSEKNVWTSWQAFKSRFCADKSGIAPDRGKSRIDAVKLSVRTVTEFVLRCGDIDSRYVDSSVMQNGAKAHRMLQKQMGPAYRREVTLRLAVEVGGIPILLQGRADGVIEDESGITIDEIKTTTLPLDRLWEQRELHLGQAKCYAHMLLREMESPPEQITVQLTYYQLDEGELTRHVFPYTRDELTEFFDDLMRRYGDWLRFEREWKFTRDLSVKQFSFPFETYRRGQREMAVAVYRAIEKQKKLYIQAPTGIGKTLSALFPSVKAIGEHISDKLFYLTAKTVTRTVVEDAMRLMLACGLRFKSLTLRAKDKICFQDITACNPDSCEYARGHYDRINEALFDLLEHNDIITPAIVGEFARRHRVCPYEMTLDASLWSDLVICDYNHVFDPVVYLKRFFGDDQRGDYTLLIDEAHNLPDRVREMYTAHLKKSDFMLLSREFKEKTAVASRLKRSMNKINSHMLAMRKACAPENRSVSDEQDLELTELAFKFTKAAGEWLAHEQHSGHSLHSKVLELYFDVLAYLGIAELFDERYAAITEVFGSDCAHTLFCLDPSFVTAQRLMAAKSSVFFSATLTPLTYYREILGGGDGDGIVAMPSPFDSANLLLAAHRGISTRYAHRTHSIEPLSDAIFHATARRRGNYIAYFPSYDYMRQVHAEFTASYPQVNTLLQQNDMNDDARAAFLAHFAADNTETLVGFCALGGIFSEGIDLIGERLVGSIIIGVGLPRISLRQDLIRDYFDRRNGHGFDYAYVFPGMNKVLQAAGRVIRAESDRGFVLLLDDRFASAKYRGLYPAHWSHLRVIDRAEQLDALFDAFGWQPPSV